jgi:hypothetical protein
MWGSVLDRFVYNTIICGLNYSVADLIPCFYDPNKKKNCLIYVCKAMIIGALSSGVKRLDHIADCSPPSSAKCKNS